MTVSPGQIIGSYRILEPLGQGGMASVYKAQHEKLNRVVALKLIHPYHLEDPNFRSRFEREAQIIAQLEHPNIVPVYDYAEHEGQPYIVLKYIEGTTLKNILQGGMPAQVEAMRLLRGIAAGLDYAHGRGVLHRDIKPSNIMIDPAGTPYLTDFGLARLTIGGATTLSQDMLIGTPFYMSPEQARGDEDIDPRADLYALGVVAYELLTGALPYTGGTPYAILNQHMNAPLPAPRQANPQLQQQAESVLLRALAKDRSARYPSATALVESLGDALGLPAPMPTASVTHAIAPSPRRRPRPGCALIWLIGGIIALALMAFLAFGGIRRLASVSATATSDTLSRATQDAAPVTPTATGAFTLLEVPALSLEAAQAAIRERQNDPIAYLALFRALLISGQIETLESVMRNGLLYTDNAAQYLLTAAEIARQEDQPSIAVSILRLGLSELVNDPTYPVLRQVAGQALYTAATDPTQLDLFEIRRAADSSLEGDVSLIFTAMRARALVTNGNVRLARVALNTVTQRSPGLPEALLIEGDLMAAESQTAAARAFWEQARAAETAPDWVRSQAATALGESG